MHDPDLPVPVPRPVLGFQPSGRERDSRTGPQRPGGRVRAATAAASPDRSVPARRPPQRRAARAPVSQNRPGEGGGVESRHPGRLHRRLDLLARRQQHDDDGVPRKGRAGESGADLHDHPRIRGHSGGPPGDSDRLLSDVGVPVRATQTFRRKQARQEQASDVQKLLLLVMARKLELKATCVVIASRKLY